MRVLLDTDILVALLKGDDSNHKRATSLFRRHKKSELFISSLCIPEAATVLSYKLSHASACAFLQDVRKRQLTEIPLDSDITRHADAIFTSAKNERTSWIDCCNVAIMRLHLLDSIASFDKFYRRMGVSVIP